MKSICLCLFGLMLSGLAGCASEGATVQKPDPARDDAQKCVATSLDRDKCAQYANQRCAHGFDVFEREAAEEDGVVRRAFYFRCL